MSKLKRGITRVAIVLVVAVALLAPSMTLAAAVNSDQVGTPSAPILTLNSGGSGDFAKMILNVINIFIWVIGVVAVFYLLLSGFNYITAGGDDEKATAARKGIINAIIGIIVVVATFFILRASVTASGLITGGGGTPGAGNSSNPYPVGPNEVSP